MRILIIGDYYEGIEDAESAKTATRSLGRALAASGNELIVCTDNPDTADHHFVLGALEAAGDDFSLKIYSPAGVDYPFKDSLNNTAFHVRYEMSPFADWEIVHMEVTQYADVIILIGGAGEWHYVTKMLGLSALALRKIVVPIASFGGEARSVWESLSASSMRTDYQKIGYDISSLNSPWRAESATEICAMLSKAYRDRQLVFSAPNADLAVHVDPELVFVIIAYTADMEYTMEAIVGACKSHGLKAERVKDVEGDYKITDKMERMIHSARYIVCDLTHERPNVYFELGYARGIGKTVITIAKTGSPVHFDVKDWTYMPYDDSRPLERDLRRHMQALLDQESQP